MDSHNTITAVSRCDGLRKSEDDKKFRGRFFCPAFYCLLNKRPLPEAGKRPFCASLIAVVDRGDGLPAAAYYRDRGDGVHHHEAGQHAAHRDDRRQSAREQFAREGARRIEHVERAVEAPLLLVGYVALRRGYAYRIARDAAEPRYKAHYHHQRYRRIEIEALQQRYDYVNRKRDSVLGLDGQMYPVMHRAADRSPDERHAPDEHVDIFPVIEAALEKRQRYDAGGAARYGREREIDRDGEKSLLAEQVLEALLYIAQQALSGGGRILLELSLLDVLFLRAYARLHDGGDEEADGVDAEQRRYADEVVKIRRDGDHDRRERLEQAGYRVGLGVVALGYQQGIEALEGDHVDAVYRAEYEGVDGKEHEAEHASPDEQGDERVEPGGDEVERVYRLLAREPVEYRAGEDGHYYLRQRENGDVDREEEGRLGIVEHHQAQREA